MSEILFIEPHYFPSLEYTTLLLKYKYLHFDFESKFKKQTYRNRCRILTANGPMDLIIPVQKGKSKLSLNEVEISYQTNWQHQHFHAIKSAYGKTAFYESYADDLKAIILDSHYKKLGSLLNDCLDFYNNAFQIDFREVGKTGNTVDLRNRIEPKIKSELTHFQKIEYQQAFSDKFGFSENLSAIDLLFNFGPESFLYLEEMST